MAPAGFRRGFAHKKEWDKPTQSSTISNIGQYNI